MSIKIKQSTPRCIKATGCCGCYKSKLNIIDYLADIPDSRPIEESFVEVQFKNTRKGYFLNSNGLALSKGDMVAVEAAPGYDLGEVTLTGLLVDVQMRKSNYRHPNGVPRKIYRIATEGDREAFKHFQSLEEATMIESRQIAANLGLEMKIGDVEYQGDGTKAIFYYIADGRVDFRQLIRKLADAFKIRIEMKQIGVRQEAGLIGGLGPCGRQLCCSGWLTNFSSVSTNAARLQDLSLNPQKLAGQCGKLKCCLNFEADIYLEAQEKLPPRQVKLQTEEGSFTLFKSDILSGAVTYVQKKEDRREIPTYVTITAERAFEIIEANKQGVVPLTMLTEQELMIQDESKKKTQGGGDILEKESLTRFDTPQKNNEGKGKGKRRERNKRQGAKNRQKKQDEHATNTQEQRTANKPKARNQQQEKQANSKENKQIEKNPESKALEQRQRRRSRRPQRAKQEPEE